MSKHIPRVYCESLQGEYFDIPQSQILHFLSVFRMKKGDPFIAFNPRDGEWNCVISELNKKRALGKRQSFVRAFTQNGPKLALAFCLIKKENIRFIIEKGTELGVSDFYPLTSDYSKPACDIEKARCVSTLAAEQSERLDIPNIHETQSLPEFIRNLPDEFKWYSAIEKQASKYSLDNADLKGVNCGFIIGPEGGFSEAEKDALKSHTSAVSLSNNTLRSETAALACLAVFNSKNL